jgi:hypothetical protein
MTRFPLRVTERIKMRRKKEKKNEEEKKIEEFIPQE